MQNINGHREIINLLKAEFGVGSSVLKPLPGYDNINFKVIGTDGKFYVLKINEQVKSTSLFESESKLLDCLNKEMPSSFPQPLKTLQGANLIMKGHKIYRLFNWLDGDFLSEIKANEKLLRSFGHFLANMDKKLMKIDDPVVESRIYDWDLTHFRTLKNKVDLIDDPAIRKLVLHYLLQFTIWVEPEFHTLRKSIIHNDANDHNVLTKENLVIGLIDFGDVVFAPIIQEITVAITYLMMDTEDPVNAIIPFLRSYHKVLPLEEKEIDLLYYLVGARLSISLIHSFEALHNGTDDDYTLVSQQPAIALLKKWIAISPDKASHVFREALGMTLPEETDYPKEIERRHQHISKVLSLSYQKPVKMKRAAFQYMFDADGNTYLDAYNNIPHVGHQHPRVVEAAQRQMAMLNTNTRYLYDQLGEYAERMIAKFPKPLNKVFFVNSGSEASDLAIRIAQTVTNNKQVAVLEHGYHGNTRMAMDISHYKFAGKGGAGAKDFITVLPIPDTFRGAHRNDDGTAGKVYAKEAVQLIENNGNPLAAFIAEPIVGCGGQVPLAKDYLKNIYPEIRKRGSLCISDEVQVGFGRLGSHFWGFEMHGVVPDMVVLGKPMGNGHPIGAVVTTDAIAEAFDNGMEFFSSFGGNPVSCAIGMAVLDVIEKEKLQQNALKTGNYFMEELRKLQDNFLQIGDVRGSGLFIGIDLVTDPETREPNTELAQTIKNKLRENFILVSTDGPANNVIKMKPPLCFGREDVDSVIQEIKNIQDYLVYP